MATPSPSARSLALSSLIAVSLPLACLGVAEAQAPGSPPSRVLVLGTYHFANPGLDIVRTDVPDVLEATRQEEIARIVEALASFEPTKVVVEALPSDGPRLDSLYRAFRAGEHALSSDETQQLGFRLAARFEHDRVHPFDHSGEFPFGPVMDFAGRNDPAFAGMVMSEIQRITEQTERRHRELTIGEILRAMNDPEELASGHAMYLEFPRVGAGEGYVGADLVSKWYERNIRMFANLAALAEPEDRILVVVGAGHAPILRELVSSHSRMELVDPLGYLPRR